MNGHGMHEHFKEKVVHQVPSYEGELLSPPGGPTFLPTEQQMEVERVKKAQLMEQTQKDKLMSQIGCEFEANSSKDIDTSQEINNRGAEIRFLKRKLVIAMAELENSKQSVASLVLDKNNLASTCQQLESRWQQEKDNNEKLRNENILLKDQKACLEKLLQGSPSLRGASEGLLSLNSLSSCNQDLECLHKMVDMLKKTVLEQREVFRRLAPTLQSQYLASQQANGVHPQVSKVQSPADASPIPTLSPLLVPDQPLKPIEEGCEKMGPSERRAVSESSSSVDPAMDPAIMNENMNTVGKATVPTSHTGMPPASVQSSEDLHRWHLSVRMNPSTSGVEGLTMRRTAPVREEAGTQKVPSNADVMARNLAGCNLRDASKLDDHSVNEEVYMNVANHRAYPHREGVVLSGNTAMENQEPHRLYMPNFSPQISDRRMYGQTERAAMAIRSHSDPMTKKPNFVHPLNQQPRTEQVVSSLAGQVNPSQPTLRPHLPHHWAAFEAEEMPLLTQQHNSPSNSARHMANGTHWLLANPYPTVQSQSQAMATNPVSVATASSSFPPTPQGLGRDRNSQSCPVCHQSFKDFSVEEFQAHVFDCFDTENGPETLQASLEPAPVESLLQTNLPTSFRTCPMCQVKFDVASISQAEFEQHVHQHFDEQFELVAG